ncbi:MAG TPA: hypothetical protein VEK15_20655 [Vicinamibacteria bacterium]|nr:hypothetical protein [Vicinamibacteria bacterium]
MERKSLPTVQEKWFAASGLHFLPELAHDLLYGRQMRALWRKPRGLRPRAPYANLIAFMRDRLAKDPGDQRLRQSLATHLGMAGRYDEAVAEVEKLLESGSSDFETKRLLVGLKFHRLLRGLAGR